MRNAYALLAAAALLVGAQAQTLYETSFENPPFNAGESTNGIDSWANGSGTGASHTVSNELARSGDQSIKWDNSGTSNSFYSIRRVLNWQASDQNKLVVTIYVWISSASQLNRLYGLYLTSSDTGTLGSTILGLTISGNGTVRAGTTWSSTYSGAGIGQANAGTFADRWLKIELTHDRETGAATAKISGFSDNSEISANLTQSTVPRNVNIGTDYVTTTDRAGVGYFDDLKIEAVPGTPFEGWDETTNGGGDAGNLPESAQKITAVDTVPCEAPVNRVRGDHAASDVDMYVICITDPSAFVATTVGFTTWDTQLWLFRCDGTGVVFNDDVVGGTTLQSRIDNSSNCITEAGIYLLAISRYNQDPLDSSGALLWADSTARNVRCADGPGAANPVASWNNSSAAGGRYVISLTGAFYVSELGCDEDPCNLPGDANDDGIVNDDDLLIVLFNFGDFGIGVPGDLNNDGIVNDDDLLIVLFNFGNAC